MGYSTDFKGYLSFNKPVAKELKTFINRFAETRHMMYDIDKIKMIDENWKAHCFNGDLGKECSFYTIPEDINEESIVQSDNFNYTYNTPPGDCPGLWCDWVINNKNHLVWNNAEKFYNYTEWLNFLITNFFDPLGYILNGEFKYQGQDILDKGYILVINNKIIFI